MPELSKSERSAPKAAVAHPRRPTVPVADICRDLGRVPSTIYDWLAYWRPTRLPMRRARASRRCSRRHPTQSEVEDEAHVGKAWEDRGLAEHVHEAEVEGELLPHEAQRVGDDGIGAPREDVVLRNERRPPR